MLTATVVAAFAEPFQKALAARIPKERAHTHAHAVEDAAKWAAGVLAEGLGFTCTASFGGGAGWDTEAGVTFTFAGLGAGQLAQVQDFALALKSREAQQAVVFLVREEQFALL